MSRKQERRLRKKRRWKAKRAEIRRARDVIEHGVNADSFLIHKGNDPHGKSGFIHISAYHRAVVLNPSWMAKVELA